jgi:hypothetical protein
MDETGESVSGIVMGTTRTLLVGKLHSIIKE